jgi:hypothetical protein
MKFLFAAVLFATKVLAWGTANDSTSQNQARNIVSFNFFVDPAVRATGQAEIHNGNEMAARPEALRHALREAIRQKMHNIMTTPAAVAEHETALADNIYSKYEDYVVTHEVKSEGKVPTAEVYRLEISATLKIDQLAFDLWKLLIRNIVGIPRVMLLIQETSTASGARDTLAESSAAAALEEVFVDMGFAVEHAKLGQELRALEMKRMQTKLKKTGKFFMDDLIENPGLAEDILKSVRSRNAQYLVLGNVVMESQKSSESKFVSHALAKFVVCDAFTAQTVAATQKYAISGADITAAGADVQAASRCGKAVKEKILLQFISNWVDRQTHGEPYNIAVYNVDDYWEQGQKFETALNGIAGITHSQKPGWDGDLKRLEYNVRFKNEKNLNLVPAIFTALKKTPGFERLKLQEQSGNKIVFMFK